MEYSKVAVFFIFNKGTVYNEDLLFPCNLPPKLLGIMFVPCLQPIILDDVLIPVITLLRCSHE